MKTEPVLAIVGIGTAVTQGVLLILNAAGYTISPAMSAAITAAVTGVLAAWARSHVTPMATLPAGVADKIANAPRS